MSAKVITLATSKGGTGKSTLTRNLSAHWVNIGFKVAVIDADPQGSIINRHNPENCDQNLYVISNPEENVNFTIDELKDDFHFIVVDTGGFRNRTTVQALLHSQFAIIPLKPSADDVAAAIETHNLILELNKTPEKTSWPIKHKMILSMTQQGTIIARHVRTEVENLNLPLMKNEMFHRVAYPEAAISGLSPCSKNPESAAARDIANIVTELNEFFD